MRLADNWQERLTMKNNCNIEAQSADCLYNMKEFLIPIFYSTVAGSATLIGLGLVLYAKKLVTKYSFAVVSMAAGVLMGTAFIHLIPESLELGADYIWILAGFGAFYIIESIVGFHACLEGEEHNHALGPVAGIGTFFHSLLDGVAIGIGFEVSPQIGLITALAVLLHELPEGIFTLSILMHAKMPLKKAVFWTTIVALATPFGTILTFLLLPNLPEEVLGILLAIAAGSFIYIGASDLVPESHKARSIPTASFFFLGIIFILIITNALPE